MVLFVVVVLGDPIESCSVVNNCYPHAYVRQKLFVACSTSGGRPSLVPAIRPYEEVTRRID